MQPGFQAKTLVRVIVSRVFPLAEPRACHCQNPHEKWHSLWPVPRCQNTSACIIG